MYHKTQKGFTLVEIMVSVSIFAVVMLMISSSVYTVFDANRKSQSLRVVMDNLNLSLEAMTRSIRFGTNYHCDINSGNLSSPADCNSLPLTSSMAVTESNGNVVTYRYDSTSKRIIRNNGSDAFVTGSDVTIDSLGFIVTGSAPYSSGGNTSQPKVIVVITGHAGTKATSQSSFSLQTTISQRQFDSQ